MNAPLDPMFVWVVIAGEYSELEVIGVYASAAAAMADQPPADWDQDEDGIWFNEKTWVEAREIIPFEVKGRQA